MRIGDNIDYWDIDLSHMHEGIMVDMPRHERVSALLGPDGEPLRVPYPRFALGFDLRKRSTP